MAGTKRARQQSAPCPHCGGNREFKDRDRWCEKCRERSDLFQLVAAIESGFDYSTIGGVPGLLKLACDRWGTDDPKAALAQLGQWLDRECAPAAGTVRDAREVWLRLTIAQVAEMLASVAEAATDGSQGTAGPEAANSVSDDCRSARWNGVEYSFTANQAKVVAVLYENFQNGTPDVGDETLLSAIDHESPPRRLNNVFRGNPAWGTMIVQGDTKGSHRLSPEKMA